MPLVTSLKYPKVIYINSSEQRLGDPPHGIEIKYGIWKSSMSSGSIEMPKLHHWTLAFCLSSMPRITTRSKMSDAWAGVDDNQEAVPLSPADATLRMVKICQDPVRFVLPFHT